jgi:hypothetical protein
MMTAIQLQIQQVAMRQYNEFQIKAVAARQRGEIETVQRFLKCANELLRIVSRVGQSNNDTTIVR